MPKKAAQPKIYKVMIQKTYRNNEGYIFFDPKDKSAETIIEERTFTLVYSFQKISNAHNPMFVIKAVQGEDFKGRLRLIKHFEENHALAYAVQKDGLFEALNAP